RRGGPESRHDGQGPLDRDPGHGGGEAVHSRTARPHARRGGGGGAGAHPAPDERAPSGAGRPGRVIPRRLVLATANPGKTAELVELLREWGTIDVLDLACFPGLSCPEERGTTYAENAVAKATAVAVATGLPALADDSGLEVDALDGAPGV